MNIDKILKSFPELGRRNLSSVQPSEPLAYREIQLWYGVFHNPIKQKFPRKSSQNQVKINNGKCDLEAALVREMLKACLLSNPLRDNKGDGSGRVSAQKQEGRISYPCLRFFTIVNAYYC